MGDRDYRQIITSAIDGFTRDLRPKIDVKDNKTIHVFEIVRCLRRSYFDRTAPKKEEVVGFYGLIEGLLRKMSYGSAQGEFTVDDIKLKAQADLIVDNIVITLQVVTALPENPLPADALYLNACLWVFNKDEGVIVYITGDGKESSFYLSKNKKMFEEFIRRVRVLSSLLGEKKVPVLEPSPECNTCQYYEECYIKKKRSSNISFDSLFGSRKEEK
jgi:CRISPR-associated exonuclease Cas4